MSDQSNSSSSGSDDENKPVSNSENNVYSNVLTKLEGLRGKSEEEKQHRDVLIDGGTYLEELIATMEEHKNSTIDRETAILIENGLKAFLEGLGSIKMNELFGNSSVSAYEVFYSYIKLLNQTGMKNYLKRLKMNAFVKVLYGELIAIILQVIGLALTSTQFTMADLKEPLDNQELFQLMLNFVKVDLESDSSSTYSTISELILMCIWNYSDKTVVVPNLVKVGYPEAVIKWLSIANR